MDGEEEKKGAREGRYRGGKGRREGEEKGDIGEEREGGRGEKREI